MTTDLAAANDTSTTASLDAVLDAAANAAPLLRRTSGRDRAAWLAAVAEAIEAARAELLGVAVDETHLPEGPLNGEIDRTVFQLNHCGEAAAAGSPVLHEAADPDYPVAPRPDLVQVLVPLGPVLVFAASNFPFAFSVAGNDTASALAAGCPVVVKAHPGHPELSRRTARVVRDALAAAGAPAGTFALIEGVDEGVAALRDPRIKACGFTGSQRGGRALFDIAAGRPDPIPFYGELGSINPVYVTPAAAAARRDEIAQGYAVSFTLRGGQLCTKPGVLLAPRASGLADAAAAAVTERQDVALLTESITGAYQEGVAALAAAPGAENLLGGAGTAPALVRIPAADLLDERANLEECFGPASVVVEYDDPADLPELARRLGPSLTTTIHAEDADDSVAADLVPTLETLSGRLIWNGWPTGVSVSRALHHGGPYPATTSPTYGSIGAGSMMRWLRPVTYQNYPTSLLPAGSVRPSEG